MTDITMLMLKGLIVPRPLMKIVPYVEANAYVTCQYEFFNILKIWDSIENLRGRFLRGTGKF